MANRSDFARATLPRSIKRMIALQPFANAHEEGEQRRLWIAAHDHHRRVRNRQQAARVHVSGGDDE